MIPKGPISIGVDPDLHRTAFAAVCEQQVLAVGVARVASWLKGPDAVAAMVAMLRYHHSDAEHSWDHWTRLSSVLVVEGQQIYAGGKKSTKGWDSVLLLAQVAGAAAGILTQYRQDLIIPRPQKWKGSIPKAVHQARVLKRRGIEYDMKGSKTPKSDTRYCVPRGRLAAGSDTLADSDWKHVVDAIGLADWGLAQIKDAR